MWPPPALDFLRELEANNDRDWFKTNRARYDTDLLGPARELTEKLSKLGEPHFFRPWNNTRFRPGPPLKEHIAFTIGDGAAVFRVVNRVIEGGHEPRRFAADMLDRFRDLIVLAAVPDAAQIGLLDLAPDRAERMGAQAEKFVMSDVWAPRFPAKRLQKESALGLTLRNMKF